MSKNVLSRALALVFGATAGLGAQAVAVQRSPIELPELPRLAYAHRQGHGGRSSRDPRGVQPAMRGCWLGCWKARQRGDVGRKGPGRRGASR